MGSTSNKLTALCSCTFQRSNLKRKTRKEKNACVPDLMLLTVCLELAGLAASAARLINGLNNEDVLSATL